MRVGRYPTLTARLPHSPSCSPAGQTLDSPPRRQPGQTDTSPNSTAHCAKSTSNHSSFFQTVFSSHLTPCAALPSHKVKHNSRPIFPISTRDYIATYWTKYHVYHVLASFVHPERCLFFYLFFFLVYSFIPVWKATIYKSPVFSSIPVSHCF